MASDVASREQPRHRDVASEEVVGNPNHARPYTVPFEAGEHSSQPWRIHLSGDDREGAAHGPVPPSSHDPAKTVLEAPHAPHTVLGHSEACVGGGHRHLHPRLQA